MPSMQTNNTSNILIRPPIVAGTFYPDDPEELKKTIEGFLDKAVVGKQKTNVKALILPHAGYVYSGPITGYGLKTLRHSSFDRVILLGPSHHFAFKGLVAAGEDYWETPLGKIKVLSKNDFPSIKNKEEIIESIEIHQPEHCLEVQLPFLQMVLKDFQIFPLLTGEIEAQKAAKILMPLIEEETLIIASSDLSHYLPYSEAKMVDKVTIDAILSNDIPRLNKYGEACGKKSIEILLHIAQQKKWQPKLLCAMNSGETVSGICSPKRILEQTDEVVGYASIAYYEPKK
ncbi:MAG: AmmeMemoRadiSam system protein B [Candidatus Pacebacteria bacterium]|nr:AmmeMemoRadiSam system protein B [Candidatus Paceibacterota bacterium]